MRVSHHGIVRLLLGVGTSALLAGTAAAQTAPLEAPAATATTATTRDDPAAQAAPPTVAEAVAPDSGDIIVTAQRREQRLTDVPVSVAAVTGAQLAAVGVRGTEDLALVTPSISVNKHIAPYQTTIRIRGVGTDVSAPTIESSVSMVVDGVVIARQGSFFTDLIDIDRIEVLRGPQSTLFGKNAVAGVLNIVTRRPDMDGFSSTVEGTVNDYRDVTVRGTISGPVTPNLGIRVTGSVYDEGRGVVRNVNPTGPRLDNARSAGVRAKMLWEPVDDATLTLIGDYRYARGPNGVRTPTRFESATVENFYGLGPVDRDNRRVNIDGGPLQRNDYLNRDWGVSLEGDVGLGAHQLTSITAYRNWSLDSYLDIDGTGRTVTPSGFDDVVVRPGVGSVATGRFPLIGSSQAYNFIKSHQFSQELRLTSPSKQPLRYVLGLYYLNSVVDFDITQFLRLCPVNSNVLPVNVADGDPGALTGTCRVPPPSGVFTSARNIYDVRTDYYAAFGQADWDLAARLTLTGGLRLQQERFAYDVTGLPAAVTLPGATNAVPAFSGGRAENRTILTGRASLAYKPGEDSNLYVSYARGYKGPGLDAIATGTRVPAAALEPETVNAYEAGFKARLFDRQVTFNLAAFWQEIDNLQESAFDTATATLRAINAGASRQRGVELETAYRPDSHFDIAANLVYLDAEYRDFTNADCFAPRALNPACVYTAVAGAAAAGQQDISGGRVPYSPKWSATVNAGYRLPLSASNDFVLRADARHVSRQLGVYTQDPASIIPAYQIVNLQAGIALDGGRMSLMFFVNNVFDQSYSIFRRSYSYSGVPTPAGNTVLDIFAKDSRRMFGATLRVGSSG